MKNNFSIKRIGLLLQRYFLENFYQEIMFWSIITFLFIVIDHRNFVITVLFISGLISSIRLQHELLRGSNGMHYLLIPATHSEKIATTIFLNTLYHFGMILLSYTIGNLLIMFVYHTVLKIQIPVNWDIFELNSTTNVNGIIVATMQNVFWSILGYFALFQAVFMLGTLYFKKNALPQTILVIIGIFLFLFLIQLTLFKALWDVKYLSNAISPAVLMIKDGTLPEFIKIGLHYGSYILLPFIWIVSYFKLTEKEI